MALTQTSVKQAVVESDFHLADEMQPRHPVSAWVMSLVTHAALFVVLGVSWQMIPRDASVDSDRTVGIVLVHQQEGKREYTDPSLHDATDQQAAAAALSQAMPGDNEVPVDLTSALPGAARLTSGSMADSILDATKLTGDGKPRPGGTSKGTSTEVFGITGVGTTFVYVFDRSGSMDNFSGKPLRAAKMELTQSLADLDTVHRFQVIFYNNEPKIFKPQGRAELIWGDTENKLLAKSFIASIKASGGTEHLSALKKALDMGPDVIFFLTDADQPKLTFGELQKIQRWNRGTTIHAIEFGAGPQFEADNFLMKLARQNAGQHAYVDVRRIVDDQ